MNWRTLVTRGKKAMRMPPRVLLARLRDEARQQTKRPWANVHPSLLRDATVFGGRDANRWWHDRLETGPFFLRPSDRERWIAAFRHEYPAAAVAIPTAADRLLRHEFDLLGSGPIVLGASLPWHQDFKTGREWPLRYCRDIEYLELDRPSDVKVPWELSRAQHLTMLGQAYWLTGDERYPREFVAQVDDWIARNPLGYGVNWACAMDVALRAVSWMWALYYMGASSSCADEGFRRRFARSMFLHGEFVSRNLETSDINGNHFLSDAVGLVFLGVLFNDTATGREWLALGRRILIAEMDAQVHPDGVDHEGSTPYHRLVLELFLVGYLLLECAGESIPDGSWARLERMLEFVAAYTKPDGSIPLVGDADDGRVHKLGLQAMNDHRYLLSTTAVRFGRGDFKTAAGQFWDESFWLLGPDGARASDRLPGAAALHHSAAFPDGGYYVLRNASTHVFVDCGEVGMRGRGGHGHNDTLSFELFMNGAGVITDCGAFVYTASREWRNKFRSTAFHNTIQIDDQEVNRFVEADALWQLHYDAVPADVRWNLSGPGGYWQGSHTGYQRMTPPSTPARAMWLAPDRPLLAVRDRVEGTSTHRVTWRWHLDPSCEASFEGSDCRISTPNGVLWMLPAGMPPASFRLEDGWVSASYGVKTPTKVIVLDVRAALPVSFSYLFTHARLDGDDRTRAMSALAAAAAAV
jgi:uncharacterized heparinase superfamily protein